MNRRGRSRGRSVAAAAVVSICTGCAAGVYAATFVTADLDARYRYRGYGEHHAEVTAVGLGLRQVFADRSGDRLTVFLFGEAMHNVQLLMLEQAYVLYKGPLGTWNVSVGRFDLPFGLLPTYQAKRLLVQTIEGDTLGLSSDNGFMLSGVVGDYEYAMAFTQGVGISGWQAVHGSGLVSGRLGWLGREDDGLRLGVSAASGASVLLAEHDGAHDAMPETVRQAIHRRLLAVDAIWYHGARVFRAEIAAGTVATVPFIGAFWGVDVGVLPMVDFTVGHRFVQRADEQLFSVTGGLSCNNVFGFQVRAAQEYFFAGEGAHAFMVQVYRAFAFSW